jgi:hypothetical protein
VNDKLVSTEEQLQLLKAMTIRTGSIHEAQALQLKMWPRLIEGVTSSEARLDVDTQSVTFLCKGSVKKSKVNKALYENIGLWVRKILWDKTQVIIKINGKAVYKLQ